MNDFLEKLSRHWQIRFLAAGAGILLIVYAVLMPDTDDKSRNASIASVDAAPIAAPAPADSSSLPVQTGAGVELPVAATVSPGINSAWLGANHALADQLTLTSQDYLEAELPRDFSDTVHELRTAAEAGNPVAQFLLGHAYQSGLGVPKDMTETARWYARAAQPRAADAAQGASPIAPQNFGQAFDSYRKAAEQGDANAQLYLGLAYDLGQDVPRNAATAAQWYRLAAAQGSDSAAANLGVLYSSGDGVAKDSSEAARLLRRAALHGRATAQYGLGRLYFAGDGVQQSYAEAAAWFQKAAQQGSVPAQVLLSRMYAAGEGVSGSAPMAYMWINLASAREQQARASRAQAEKLLAPAEVAEGQRLTRAWLARYPQSSL